MTTTRRWWLRAAVRAAEGESLTFTVSLSSVSGRTASVVYATSDGSAAAVLDYGAESGTLVFAPGERVKTVEVATVDDDIDEAVETLELILSNADNAVIRSASVLGSIDDTDSPPALTVVGSEAEEGTRLIFEVRLSAISGLSVAADYLVAAITAHEGDDYAPVSGRLVVPAGDRAATIELETLDDPVDEEDEESLELRLSNPANATVAVASAVGTITDNDEPPALSVLGASAVEGGFLRFAVSLSEPSAKAVAVDYESEDDSALAGQNYNAVSGTLRFTPGAREEPCGRGNPQRCSQRAG